MSDFLLVHGSCHGAWCWQDTIREIGRLGHQARAIDLPDHGTGPGAQVTLDDYARAIVAAIATPVILVGHSAGGFAIAAAAELAPEKIVRLVYLCAYVPREGMTLADLRRSAVEQPLIGAIRLAPDRQSFTIDPQLARSRFYADVPPDVADRAVSMLRPQPVLPQETALTPRHSLDLPRDYIRTSRDNAVPLALQEAMSAGFDRDCIHFMPTDHSPFLSDPAGLAGLLTRIAAK